MMVPSQQRRRSPLVASLALVLGGCSGALGPLPCNDATQCLGDMYCKKDNASALGVCTQNPACPAEKPEPCSGTCQDLAGDVNNCGACGNVCPVPTGGTTTCVARACAPSCPSPSKLIGAACTPPPAAPTGVVATGGVGKVTLTWTSSPGLTYSYLRGTASASYSGLPNGPITSPFTDSSVAPGTRYFYEVFAIGPAGTSTPSSEVNAITAPPAPTGLTAVGGSGSIALTWNRAQGADSYNVYGGAAGAETLLVSLSPVSDPLTGATVTKTEPGLQDGQRRSYVIEAVNAGGKVKGTSASGLTVLPAPANLVATPSLSGVALDWTGPAAATSYDVFVSSDGGVTFTLLGSADHGHFDHTTSAQASAYVYKVVARTADATSAPVLSAPVTTPLAAPANLNATALDAAITLSWSQVTAASGYDVLRQTGGAGSFVHLGTAGQPTVTTTACSSGVCSYPDGATVPGQGYAYQVVALSGAVSSAATAPVSSAGLLSAPVLQTPTAQSTKVSLAWSAVTGAAGYEVLRSLDGTTFTLLGATRPTVSGGSALTYSDAAVSPGIKYYYKVEAWTAFTVSTPSAVVSTQTTLDAPTGLSLVGSAKPGAVGLSWNAIPGATGYSIEVAAGTGAFAALGTSGAASYTDDRAVGAVTYTYRVFATSAAARSPASGTLVVPVPLLPPAWLAVDSPHGVIIWPASSGATGYNVTHATNPPAWSPVSALTPSVNATTCSPAGLCIFSESLPLFTTEYYSVQAYAKDGAGNVQTSAFTPAVALLSTAVSAPDLATVKVTTTATDVTITWPVVSGASYTVRRAPAPSGPWKILGYGPGAYSGFLEDDGLTPGSTMYYTLQVYLADSATSAQTAPIAAKLLAAGVATPIGLTASVDASFNVNASWTAAPGVTWNVYFSQDGGTTWTAWAKGLTTPATSLNGLIGPLLIGVQAVGGAAPSTTYSALATTPLTVPNPPLTIPANLTVVSTSTSTPQNVLNWSSASGATFYSISISTNGSVWTNRPSVPASTTTFSDTNVGLTAGTSYWYSVRAVYPYNTSMRSPGVSVVTPLPNAPSNVAVSAINKGSTVVSWSQVQAMNVNGGYNVYRSVDGTNFTQLGQSPTVPATSASFTDNTLPSAGPYYYKVQAWTPAVPTGGPLSPAASIILQASTPVGPTGLTATAVTSATVALGWSGSLQNAYNVLRSTDGGANFTVLGASQPTVPTGSQRYVDSSLSGAQLYVYRVQGVPGGTNGVTLPSAPLQVATPLSGLIGAGGPTQAVIAWTAAPGALQYSVYRNSSPGQGATGTPLLQTSHNSFADLGVTPNTWYYVVTATYPGAITSPAAEVQVQVGSGGIGGTKIDTRWSYQQGAGFTQVPSPYDLTPGCQTCNQIQAGYWQGGAFVQANTVGSWDGNFAISGVPQQEFLVAQVPPPPAVAIQALVTSARTLDLGVDDFGRPDAATINLRPTYLTVSSSGLAGYNPLDVLETFGLNTQHNIYGLSQLNAPGQPNPGDTSVNGLVVDSWLSFGRRLLDGAKGDDLAMYQLSTANVTDASGLVVPLQRLVRFGNATSVPTQVDGKTSSLNIPLAVPSVTAKLNLKWSRTAFQALFSQVHPAAVASPSLPDAVYVDASPGDGAGVGNVGSGGTPDLLVLSPPLPEVKSDLDLGQQSFGSPWPANWPLFCRANIGTASPIVMPGAQNVLDAWWNLQMQDSLANCNAQALAGGLAPRLGPVQSLQINGLDATLSQSGVGPSPTLSWRPPALGTPDYYQVLLYRTQVAGQVASYARIAIFTTTATQLALPPVVFSGADGTGYFAMVNAARRPGFSIDRAFRKRSIVEDYAPAESSVFLLGALPAPTSGGCVPKTCAQAGANCGSPPDGCGGVLTSCGVCGAAAPTCNATLYVCQ